MPPKKYKTNPIVKKISDIKVKTKNNNKTRKLLEKVIEKYKQHLKTKDSSRPTSSPVSFDLGVPALPLDEALIEASKHDPMIPRNDIPPIDIPEKFIPPASNNPSTPPHHISYSDISPLHNTEYSPHTNKDYVQPMPVSIFNTVLPYGVPSLTADEIIDNDLFTINTQYKGGKKKRNTRKRNK